MNKTKKKGMQMKNGIITLVFIIALTFSVGASLADNNNVSIAANSGTPHICPTINSVSVYVNDNFIGKASGCDVDIPTANVKPGDGIKIKVCCSNKGDCPATLTVKSPEHITNGETQNRQIPAYTNSKCEVFTFTITSTHKNEQCAEISINDGQCGERFTGDCCFYSLSHNGDWKYHKEIAIKENSGKTLTDYQVLVELKGDDFPSKAKTDGADIRFRDAEEKELSYWVEEYDYSGKHAKIWVKVLNIPANGETKIKMYYGNPSSSSQSNGDAVFVFFDNFEGTSLDTNKWETQIGSGGSVTVSGGKVRITSPTTRDSNTVIISKSSFNINNIWQYTISEAHTDDYNGLSFPRGAWDTTYWRFIGKTGEGSDVERISRGNGGGRLITEDNVYYSNTDVSVALKRNEASEVVHNYWDSDGYSLDWGFFGPDITLPTTFAFMSRCKLGMHGWLDVDIVKVRKYADPEPTVTIVSTIPTIELILFEPEIDDLLVKINGVVKGATKPLHWDWGDGTQEESWFPGTHKYAAYGTYKVLVTAYGEGSTTVTKSKNIELKPPVTVVDVNNPPQVDAKQNFDVKVSIEYSFSSSTNARVGIWDRDAGHVNLKDETLSGRGSKMYSFTLTAPEVTTTTVWHLTAYVGYWENGEWHQPSSKEFDVNIVPDSELFWDFNKDFEGWDRSGSVPPWHTMESGIMWYDSWAGAQGVIVIDACESTPTGYEDVHASGGIKKTFKLPSNAKKLTVDVVKHENDGGIRFIIIDSEDQHVLGEEILSGRKEKKLSYDISEWAGKKITLEIRAFGAGTDMSGCWGSTHGCGTCCGEYVGVNWVKIEYEPSERAKVLIDRAHHSGGHISEADVENQGFSAEALSVFPLDTLNNYDVILIITPSKAYTSMEIQKITDFVKNGGGLLAANDWATGSSTNTINPILQNFGISAVEVDAGWGPYSKSNGQLKEHEITQGLNAVHAGAVSRLNVPESASIIIQESSSVIAAATSYGAGRVVVLGDDDLIRSDWGYDNTKFLKNILTWLSTSSTPSPAVSSDTSSLSMEVGDSRTIKFTVSNNGGDSDTESYLSVSVSSGLHIEEWSSSSSDMNFVYSPVGSEIWNSEGKQITSEYELLDAYEAYSAGETNTVTIKVKATASGSQWLKYRTAFDTLDSGYNFIRNPTSGPEDEQGWHAYEIPAEVTTPIAEYYAPIIYQDVADDNPRADYITKFNYDGDWIGNNNGDNLENYKLLPYVYYSVAESENHWFICYAIFHPRDTQLWHDLDLLNHENDMEGLLMVVEKDGTRYGRLCCMVTVAHLDFFSFVVPDSDIEGNEEDIDGKISFEGCHPRIYVQAKGHGVFGSPGNYYNKNPTGPIHIGNWESGFPTGPLGGYGGIVYYPGDKAEEPSLDTLKKENAQRVSYKLISIDQLWVRRFDIGEGKTFDNYGTFDGDCGGMDPTCSEDAAHAPWAWDDTGFYPITAPDNVEPGVIFTDPIKLVSVYFKGVVTQEEEYITNPYKTQTRKVLEGISAIPQNWKPWCAWASAQMVLKYYGYDITQEHIGETTCKGTEYDWNEGLPLVLTDKYIEAIKHLSHDSLEIEPLTTIDKGALLKQIKEAIENENPIIVISNGAWLFDLPWGIKWPMGAHASVVVGYSLLSKEGLVKELPGLGVSPPAIKLHDPATADVGFGAYWLDYDIFFDKTTEGDSYLMLWVVKGGAEAGKYQKEITIKENSGKTLTDYQILVELKEDDFPSKAKPDGGDIRFRDAEEKELSYWIESWDYSGKDAKIWVKVPRITVNGETKITMHYGNPSASAVSNGDATFEFFDDFEVYNSWSDMNNPSIGNDWEKSDCEVQIVSNFEGHPSKMVKLITPPGTARIWKHPIMSGNINLDAYIFELDFYTNGGVEYFEGEADACADGPVIHAKDFDNWWGIEDYNKDLFIRGYINGDEFSVPGGYKNHPVRQWLTMKEIVTSTRLKHYVDGIFYYDQDMSNHKFTNYHKVGINAHQGFGPIYADNMRVRKYTSPEPTITVKAEQPSPTITPTPTPTPTEISEIHDYDITVNSYQDGYKIGLKNNLLLSELDVYFDEKFQGKIPMGIFAPIWKEFEVKKLPTDVKISGEGKSWHKDLRKYVPWAYNQNYHVIDEVIKDNGGKEIGLKVKIEYPANLKVDEKGILMIKVFTEDYGYATAPYPLHNIQTFCIVKVAGDESLREEKECKSTEKAMCADPIIVGTVKEPLKPFNGWLPYDDELRSRIKKHFPDVSVTEDLIEAVEMLILVPLKFIPPAAKAVELALDAWGGFDFDEVCDAFAKWQEEYTIGDPPSNMFSNENDYDCWTNIYAFNIHENLCTGANAVWLKFPFSFEKVGEYEIRIHVDTMFEGDIPSLEVKGGRIGQEYPFDVSVGE